MCAFRFGVSLGVLAATAGDARAAEASSGSGSDADKARAFHEKAKAAFALSHYAQAAEFFEKAFELKSDPALLFNAAQSHRLAGNKERALMLYQNYLRVYGRDERRASIDSRIEELKRAIEHDRAAGTATSPAPAPMAAPAPVSAPVKPAPAAPPSRAETAHADTTISLTPGRPWPRCRPPPTRPRRC
jgi:tetratricopeptide (TPR) repeat protein